MSKGIYILLLLFVFVKAKAQEFIFEKPENLKNLPSQETYNIIQDDRGYIWLSTENGLCRYNGGNIRVYGKNEGLPEGACYAVVKNKKSGLWLVTSENRLLHIVNDSLIEVAASREVSDLISKTKGFVTNIKFINDSILILSSRSITLKVNVLINKVSVVLPQISKEYLFEIHRSNNICFPVEVYESPDDGNYIRSINNSKAFWFYDVEEKKGERVELSLTDSRERGIERARVLTATTSDGSLIMVTGNVVCKIDVTGKVQDINLGSTLYSVCVDDKDGVWLGTALKGLIYFAKADIRRENMITSLKGNTVTGIFQDRERNLWCTTIENGVFICKNIEVKILYDRKKVEDQYPFLFKVLDSSIYVFDGGAYKINETSRQFIGKFDTGMVYLRAVNCDENNWFISSVLGGTNIYSRDLKWKRETKKALPTVDEIHCLKNRQVLGVCHTGIFDLLKSNKEGKWKSDSEFRGVLVDNEENLFAYTKRKVYSIDLTRDSLRELFEVENIKKVLLDKNHNFWVISKINKLFQFREKELREVFLEDGIAPGDFYDFMLDGNNQVWLATSSGIFKVSGGVENPGKVWLQSSLDLSQREFVKLDFYKDKVIAATRTELFLFNKSDTLSRTDFAKLEVNQVSAGDKMYLNRANDYVFDYEDNTIKINFDVLSFKRKARLVFKMEGYADEPQVVEGDGIILNKVSYGDYVLKVWIVDDYNNRLSEEIHLNISVVPPFWETWPAIIIFLVLFILLVVFISVQLVKRIRRREAEKTRVNKMLADYRMSALRAQMNPHFIFNCINSIQRYVLTNKTQNAYDYLAKFSKLIREVLNLSEENMIPLRQELEIVELYIQMEQIRYEGYFDYEITIDEKIDTSEVFIPSLLLQPYIENGIWHGIMNLKKSRQGKIKLEVAPHGDDLQVVIEDNGVGREAAAKQKLAGHKSKALGINKQRMELVEEMNKGVKASITITDLFDEQHQPSGTRVVIIIPQALGDE